MENGCSYQVVLYGNQTGINQYSLLVKHQNAHMILKEGVPEKEFIQYNSTNYYKTYISKGDENIEKVEFILTPISGDFLVSVSHNRDVLYPTWKNGDKYSFSDYVKFDLNNSKTALTGFYYTSVTGFGAGMYSILLKITRKDSSISTTK